MKRLIAITLCIITLLSVNNYIDAGTRKSIKKTKPTIVNCGCTYYKNKLMINLRAEYKKPVLNNKKVKYVFYKKVGKKYKKVKTVSGNNKRSAMVRMKVHSSSIYYYKVKAYVKKGNKKVYSQMSNKKKVLIDNWSCSYHIETLTPSGVYKNCKNLEVVFKLTNANKYNCNTILKNNNAENTDFEDLLTHNYYFYYDRNLGIHYYTDYIQFFGKYTCSFNDIDGNEETKEYFFGLKEYSYNKKDWSVIPKNGVKVKRSKSVYIKGVLVNDKYPRQKDIYFAGSDKKNYLSSSIDAFDSIVINKPLDGGEYYGCSLNLLRKKGSAYTYEVDDD